MEEKTRMVAKFEDVVNIIQNFKTIIRSNKKNVVWMV